MLIEIQPLRDLDGVTAFEICRLRQEVFVLEQRCLYPDLDDRDLEPGAAQVVLRGDDGRVAGTARLLDDGGDWRIGRVCLAASARGRGLADAMMRAAVAEAERRDATRDIVLGAQVPLATWYATFGFGVDGPEYLEDDIPHVPMRRPAS